MKTNSIINLTNDEISQTTGGFTPNQRVTAFATVSWAINLGIDGLGASAITTLIGVATFSLTFLYSMLRGLRRTKCFEKAIDKTAFGLSMAASKSIGTYFWNSQFQSATNSTAQ